MGIMTIELPNDVSAALDEIARARSTSRDRLLAEAVETFVRRQSGMTDTVGVGPAAAEATNSGEGPEWNTDTCLESLTALLSEWDTPEDHAAYDDL